MSRRQSRMSMLSFNFLGCLYTCRRPGYGVRLNVAGKQGWKCAICISPFTGSDFDIDHKVRWNDSFDNTESNLQALCVGCHRQKTASENTHSE